MFNLLRGNWNAKGVRPRPLSHPRASRAKQRPDNTHRPPLRGGPAEGRAALVTFVMAGDPDPETSLAIVKALPGPAPT